MNQSHFLNSINYLTAQIEHTGLYEIVQTEPYRQATVMLAFDTNKQVRKRTMKKAAVI